MVMLVVAALLAAACASSEGSATAPDATPSSALTSVPDDSSNIVLDDFGVSLLVGTLTERSVDIGADGRNTTAAIAGMNEFSVDLYRSVAAESEGNVLLSPYSVSFALSMIYAGANGQTEEEMSAVLHAGGVDDWHEGINAYDLSLDARTAGSPTEWNSANKVWTTPGLDLTVEYLDVLTGDYGSPMAVADFGSNADGERQIINDWISGQTNELIPELFPAGSLDPSTAMVLVNAIALDAPWEFPFDPSSTSEEPFTLPGGSTVDVDMMHYDEFLPSAYGENYQAVEVPYGGGALSMVVIVPTDLAEFESTLSTSVLEGVIDSINDGGIHLSLPKWSSRTELTLNETLIDLGMPSAFGAGADFSGMTGSPGLFLDLVEHEAFIEVDEAGTRAAAATGGAMADSHGSTVTVDRPFLYVIRDKNAGTILFIGRVLDPTAG